LRAVKRLDLAFFIGTKNNGVFRRVEVETDDGLKFLGKIGDLC
jgi:hypothetical protein